MKSAQPGLDKTYPLTTVAKEHGHRGARRKPLKPLRAGTPGDSGVLVVTRVLSTNKSAHEAAGATGTRRPHALFGREIYQRLGRMARRGRERVFGVQMSTLVMPGQKREARLRAR